MAYSDKTYFTSKINSNDLDRLIGNDEGNLAEAIRSADSLIDSYLKNIFTVLPVNSPPDIIKQCSYDLAVFYLHDRIQYSEIPQWVKDKYNAAIDFLTKVAKGIISLNIETEDLSSQNYQAPDDNVKFFGSDTVMERGGF